MARPQTVVIISDHAFINGGQAKVALDSALGLKARGFDVRLFASVGPADPRLEAAGIPVTLLDGHDILSDPNRARAILNGVWNRAAGHALADMLRGLDPACTLVHTHGWAKALSGAVAPAIRGSGLAHVYTMHEYALACPNSAFLDHKRVEICTRKPLGFDCLTTQCDSRSYAHKGWRVMRQLGLRAGGWPKHLTHLIYLSETELEAMRPNLPQSAKLWHVTNPVDAIEGAQVPVADNDVFLFVGRLSPEKGPVLFAEAAKEAGVRAVFVGSGDEEGAVRAANPAADLTGWVTPDEVQGWIGQARALVFPSVWYETHGLVAYEAQARGVPVIVGDRCAAREAIVDGETGLWFPMASRDGLVAALKQMTDGAVAAQMGQTGFDRYWQNPLTMDRHLDQLETVYDAVMAG